MKALKTLAAATFVGGFFAAFLGLLGALILTPFFRPDYNLLPLIAAIYAVPIGALAGAVLGFITGVGIVMKRRRKTALVLRP